MKHAISLGPVTYSVSLLFVCVGSIPGPILFGLAIDIACQLWDEECGHRSSCHAYDKPAMRRNFLIMGLIIRSVTCALLLAGLCTYTPVPEDDKSTVETEKNQIDKTDPASHGNDNLASDDTTTL